MASAADSPLRSDAARNRRRVLDAAEGIFAVTGLSATMEDVAHAAGLGVGTLYRRFGSKAQLIEALFSSRVEEFAMLIDEVRGRQSAWDGLCELMREYVRVQSQSRAVKQLFYGGAEPAARLLRERVEPLLTELVERAKLEGRVRADFAATDIPILTHAISGTAHAMPGRGEELARRHLELVLKGMSATNDPHPVPPPLPDDAFIEWMRAIGNEG